MRCTLANSAYTPKELKFQYEDSGAGLVFVAEDLVSVVFDMFKLLGVSEHEARNRVVVLENGLEWAGAPPVPRSDAVKGLKTLAGLINAGGKLDHEEMFDGEQANETVFLCYSSGMSHLVADLCFHSRVYAGTTGKPKGVEVRIRVSISQLNEMRSIDHASQHQLCPRERQASLPQALTWQRSHAWSVALLPHLRYIFPLHLLNLSQS